MADIRTSIEIIASSVEEAISRGAAELGLPEDELEVEVLDEGTKGFLGLGGRQVRVRLIVKKPVSQLAQQIPVDAAPPKEGEPDTIRTTRDTVEELLQRMGIQATVDVRWGELIPPGKIRPLMVDIQGDDLSILIGRRGEALSALQYITRLIVGKELKQPTAVVIDVEGYRARRESQLRRLARRMAEQAVETGRTTSLEPMPANERRIIHIELRDDPKVDTLSVGEGNRRKVTIVPKE
jgi:spoIIIJ-associated protein